MTNNISKVARLLFLLGIYVQPKKEFCLSNGFEKLGSSKRRELVYMYKQAGIKMVDLGHSVVFFLINDIRFKD